MVDKSQSFTHVSAFNHQRRESPPGRLPGRRRRTRSGPHRRHRHRPALRSPGSHHNQLSEGLEKGRQLEVPGRDAPCYGGMEKAHCPSVSQGCPASLDHQSCCLGTSWDGAGKPSPEKAFLLFFLPPHKGKRLFCGWAALPPELCSSRKRQHPQLSFSHSFNNEAAVAAAPPRFVIRLTCVDSCVFLLLRLESDGRGQPNAGE